MFAFLQKNCVQNSTSIATFCDKKMGPALGPAQICGHVCFVSVKANMDTLPTTATFCLGTTWDLIWQDQEYIGGFPQKITEILEI